MKGLALRISDASGDPNNLRVFPERNRSKRISIQSSRKAVWIGFGLILMQLRALSAALSAEGEFGRGFVVESTDGFLGPRFKWEKVGFESAHLFWGTIDELDKALNSSGISMCHIHLVRKRGGQIEKQKTFLRLGPGKYQIARNK